MIPGYQAVAILFAVDNGFISGGCQTEFSLSYLLFSSSYLLWYFQVQALCEGHPFKLAASPIRPELTIGEKLEINITKRVRIVVP